VSPSLLIEHDMSVVMRVLGAGHRARSRSEDRRRHAGRGPRATSGFIEAYLGKDRDDWIRERRVSETPVNRQVENPLLTIDDLHLYYGNIAAVKGLSLTVGAGEIVTLIGSNGAGKSTPFGPSPD